MAIRKLIIFLPPIFFDLCLNKMSLDDSQIGKVVVLENVQQERFFFKKNSLSSKNKKPAL